MTHALSELTLLRNGVLGAAPFSEACRRHTAPLQAPPRYGEVRNQLLDRP